MSYCRTSEADSDVYVYGTSTGYVCHVKNNDGHRFNLLPYYKKLKVGWLRTALVHFDWSRYNTKKFKNHYAGRTFNAKTPNGMHMILKILQANGVRVPQRALDRLKAERDDFWDKT